MSEQMPDRVWIDPLEMKALIADGRGYADSEEYRADDPLPDDVAFLLATPERERAGDLRRLLCDLMAADNEIDGDRLWTECEVLLANLARLDAMRKDGAP